MTIQAPRPRREPTQAAEGLPRWRWTLEEFERFIELGILTEDDRVELIGGELVPMAAKGNRHEWVRAALANWLGRRVAADLWVVTELGWRPDKQTYCEPDVIVIPNRGMPSQMPPSDVRLLVEIADTTLKYDTTTKAPLYAHLGVQDYWVISAVTLETRVHREPSAKGYGRMAKFAPDSILSPLLLPELSLKLGDFEFGQGN